MAHHSLLPPLHLDRAAYTREGGYHALGNAVADPDRSRQALLATDLTGLGGAHFPLARKIASLLDVPGPRAVVCNAAEDEPGSRKDRTLLTRNPHLVLEGVLIAAEALDATDIVMYISESALDATQAVLTAIEEAATSPVAANAKRLRVVAAGTHYVAGEATAAVDAINGGPGKPTGQPPYPTERGIGGLPTLVANCETLANLPRLIRAAWAGHAPVSDSAGHGHRGRSDAGCLRSRSDHRHLRRPVRPRRPGHRIRTAQGISARWPLQSLPGCELSRGVGRRRCGTCRRIATGMLRGAGHRRRNLHR